ncbi:MAG: TraR/DksA family transcriptional regulator [Kiritimatiellia bacterium]|nr:TraR/DksA family transcriptional regulator [Lentisphaerota bacterium]
MPVGNTDEKLDFNGVNMAKKNSKPASKKVDDAHRPKPAAKLRTGQKSKVTSPPTKRSGKSIARSKSVAGRKIKAAARSTTKRTRSRGLNQREIQAALMRLRERITGQIDFLATENLNRTRNDDEISFRSEEQGTDNYERDTALTRVSSEQDLVFEIDEALNRLEMGIYGQCESCGCAIEPERMVALPYSRMCVACQSRSENERNRQRPPDNKAFFNVADRGSMEASSDNA